MPLTEGIHYNYDERDYHADTGTVSSTALKTFAYESPAAYRWQQDHPQPHKAAFDFGSVVHALVLGVGDTRVIKAASFTGKAAREERDEAYAAGVTPILEKDYRTAMDMADAVLSNRTAYGILTAGEPEVSMAVTDPETGVMLRGRADYLRANAVIDLKTSRDPVDPRSFERTAWKLHYHFQAAFYLRILRALGEPRDTFLWIAVDKTAPHDVAIIQPDDAVLANADRVITRALTDYAECKRTGVWPGKFDPNEVHMISAPDWAQLEDEEEMSI